LHDEAQLNLENLEDFQEEFKRDQHYAYFNTEQGIRKRTQEEIELAKSQAEKKARRS